MRTIRQVARFRKDVKRELRGPFRTTLVEDLNYVVQALANDAPLLPAQRDHLLTGEWQGCRDCHVKPDLLLIYRKLGDDILELMRLGSHSELGF